VGCVALAMDGLLAFELCFRALQDLLARLNSITVTRDISANSCRAVLVQVNSASGCRCCETGGVRRVDNKEIMASSIVC